MDILLHWLYLADKLKFAKMAVTLKIRPMSLPSKTDIDLKYVRNLITLAVELVHILHADKLIG